MQLFHSLLTWFIKQRIGQIEHFLKNPLDVQEELCIKLIKKAKNTSWGELYDYGSINSIKAYKERVPLQDYESIKPHIKRLMHGEQNVLWPSKITWFAKSSGTTNDKSKFIPVSKEAFEDCHFKGAKDLMSMYCNNNPDTKLFAGKGLIMGGSHQINQLNAESYYGDVSAVIMQNMPFLAQLIQTPERSVALLEDWEEKIEKIMENCMEENVTHVVGVPTWTIVLIKQMLERTGKSNLLEIWPNLELYIHGGVSFKPYQEQFRDLIPSSGMHYLETYNASEGFFGIQDQNRAHDMLLMLDYGIFYEFLPVEEMGSDSPHTLQLDEVECGRNYAIVISTNAGLWRYTIGDTIKFTSINPFKIQVSGRVKHFINAFGEEVIVDNTDRALAQACHECGAIVKDYTVAPIYISGEEKGGHEWLIEFETEPTDIAKFTEILDAKLKSVNSDYEAKRHKDIALKLPVVHSLSEGTFYEWLRSKGKLGGQHKVPRLSNNRDYVEQILEFA